MKYREEQVRLLKCKILMYYLWFCPGRAFRTTETANTMPLLYKMEKKKKKCIKIAVTKDYLTQTRSLV